MKETCENKKPCNIPLPQNTREYEIDGKICVVRPVFKEKSNESVTSILIKLMKSEN